MRNVHGWAATGGLLTVLFLAGCGLDQQAAGPNTKSDAALPGETATKGEAASAFHDLTLDQALEKAKADDKVVMVDFYTVWCPPCKMLDQKTWPDPAVAAWLREKTVAIKLDAEREEAIAEKYKVNSYPTIVFIKPDGKEIDRMIGFKPPAKFIDAARAVLEADGK